MLKELRTHTAQRQAFFSILHHAGTHLQPLGQQHYVGSNATSDVYEQRVRVAGLVCCCITIRLFQPLRDSTTELRLLSNVAANRVGAKRLAEIYRRRWCIETAFQELTENLRCEINTLGFPKAALFGFALAMTAYNVVVLIRQTVAAGPAGPPASELSSYYMANEVAAVSEGLAAWLHEMARTIRWQKYRKNPWGPKKPRQVQRSQRGAHRSTARELKNHKKPP